MYSRCADVFALCLGDLRRGGNLDQLLVAALDGAVALEQMNHVAMAVAQHLHFNVPRVDHAFFQEDFRLAKSLAGFRDHALIVAEKIFVAVAAADAAPAAAIGGLEHDGVADLVGQHARLFNIGEIAVAARHAWDTGGDHRVARLNLVAHLADDVRVRADESNTTARANFRQLGVLRKETIARMQRIAPRGDGQIDDVVRVEIAGDRFGTDVVGLVRFFYMQRMTVGIRVDGDRFDAHFRAGAHNADGNFTAVGDEYFFNHELS